MESLCRSISFSFWAIPCIVNSFGGCEGFSERFWNESLNWWHSSSNGKSSASSFDNEVGQKVLHMVAHLSKMLHGWEIEVLFLMKMKLTSLQSIWSDESYNLFWEQIHQESLKLKIVRMSELPRNREDSKKIQIGTDETSYPNLAKEFDKYVYFEVDNFTVSRIQLKFEQKGYIIIQKLWSLVTPNITEM